MFIKHHVQSNYIKYLYAAHNRTDFKDQDRINFYRYMKGYEGEQKFYELMRNVMEGIKIWDVTLEDNGESQYDFIIVCNRTVYHFDIKNFSGIYKYEDDRFISQNGRSYKNIMAQFYDAHHRLKRIIQTLQPEYVVQSKIIFINETFQISNYNGNPAIIFKPQIASFKQQLMYDRTLKMDLNLAKRIVEKHAPGEYERIYYYPFDKMMTGARCSKCNEINQFHVVPGKQYIHCQCGNTLSKREIVLSTGNEISILNKGIIRTQDVVKWTGISERAVRRYLSEAFQKSGNKKNRVYQIIE